MNADLAGRSCGAFAVLLVAAAIRIMPGADFAAGTQEQFMPLHLQVTSVPVPAEAAAAAPEPAEAVLPQEVPPQPPLSSENAETAAESEGSALQENLLEPAPEEVSLESSAKHEAAAAAITMVPESVAATKPLSEPVRNETPPDRPQAKEAAVAAEPEPVPGAAPEPSLQEVLPEKPVEYEAAAVPAEAKRAVVPQPHPAAVASVPKVRRQPQSEQKKTASRRAEKQRTVSRERTRTAPGAERVAPDGAAESKPEQSQSGFEAQLAAEKQLQRASSLIVAAMDKRLRYPKNARRRKLEGLVVLEFTLEQGKITKNRLYQSSGHEILDKAALRLAAAMSGFDTGVPGLKAAIRVPVRYQLR